MHVVSGPAAWAALLLTAGGAWVADAFCLHFALVALGAHVGIEVLLLAYTAGAIASSVPLLPAGLGVVETVTPIILNLGGVSLPTALAGILVYRVLGTVLPAIAGALALVLLRVEDPPDPTAAETAQGLPSLAFSATSVSAPLATSVLTAMARVIDGRPDDAGASQAKTMATHAMLGTKSNRWVKGAARIGLAGRGALYLIVGYLAVKVATASSARPADQEGALQTIARHPWGHALLAVLAVGFGGYAMWRFAEAAVGHGDEADAKKRQAKRVVSAVKGAMYSGICVATAALSVGRGNGGSGDTKSAPSTARLMKLPFGRELVAAIGAGIVVAGGYLVVKGLRTKFREELDTGAMHPTMEKVVVGLGLIGNVARGIVTAIAGLFLVKAAADFTPAEAKGLDGTLRTIAARPYGATLLIAAALGLFAFGLYSFCEARYKSM